MKYIKQSLKSHKITLRKYTKNNQYNAKLIIIFKSNYKYKRRCLRNVRSYQLLVEEKRNEKERHKSKQQLPLKEKHLRVNKYMVRRNFSYDNARLQQFLRIFISIMQQVELLMKTKKYINNIKNVSNSLAIRLFTKMKAIRNCNTPSQLCVNAFGIRKRHHHVYKDAIKDTDIPYIDISSNIADEISNQQHNYDKVSTITSTLIKCQRQKHHQRISTNTSTSSSPSPIAPLTSSMSSTTSLSSPSSLFVKTNYEIYQWPAILHNYNCDSPSIHHQFHQKLKHNQHHYFHQQHKTPHQHQHQQKHARYIKTLTSNSLLRDINNINKNDTSSKNNINSININKRNNSNFETTYKPTCNRVAVYQTDDQYVNTIWNRSHTLSCLLLKLFIVFTIGVRSTTAGACWQTVLDNGKCNDIFSLNISKSECCGVNQEFAYTDREPTNVEYFFATAIGGGMECSPCLENCKNVKCGPNKKCVKRKGRPKCICAPECGAARRRRKQQEHLMQQEQEDQQRHTSFSNIPKAISDTDNDNEDDDDTTATTESSNVFKITMDKSQQSRDIRSLSSEITNVNLDLENGKDVMMISGGGVQSQMVLYHSSNKEYHQNQRKLTHRHMQRHLSPHNIKELNDFPQYTHQIQQHQHQLQPKYKNQEPKGIRRLLITANVEHMEKPTTRRLQIFSNVRTTHARQHDSNNNYNRNSNKNKNKNKHDQNEDTDRSGLADGNEEYEENKYNDAEEIDDDADAKRKYNRNDKNNDTNNNKNNSNLNDDATRFLNQSLSRHKLKTIIKSSNNNGNNSSNSHNKSKKTNRKLKKIHELQTTKSQQQYSSNNSTRIRHPQATEHQAEDSSHRHHHHHNHRNNNHHRQQQHQPEQHQQHRNHNKANEQRRNHHRHHGRQKHNRQQHQQTIVMKKPKKNRDNGNATIAVLSPSTLNATYDKELESFSNLLQSKIVNTSSTTATISTLPNLSLSSSSSLPPPSAEEVDSATTETTIITIADKQSQSRLLSSSSTMSAFLSLATPVNSTMSTKNIITAANDHYRSHSPNHGSKIATSSSQSPLSTSLSYSQLSTSPTARSSSSVSSFKLSDYAEGEGVTQYDHQHRHIQIPSSKSINNNSDTDDHLISTFNTNLHNNMLQKEQEILNQQHHQQQQQQQDQQTQSHQQYFPSSLFDAMSERIDLMRSTNKQQQHFVTNTDNVRSLNPVCGTDGRTYNTECQLRKRACRTDNPNLQIAYRGHCRTTCNGVKCLNGLTCVEDQYSLPHCISCKIECLQDDYDNNVVDATKAVCGADGKTYKSVCDINRMICKIGRSVGVAYLGPCRGEQITCDDINCGPKQVCLIDLLTHKPRCTSCRYKCSRKRSPSFSHFEEGKICGANNRTYNSWCEMRKDSCSTGFYIDLKYSGSCQ